MPSISAPYLVMPNFSNEVLTHCHKFWNVGQKAKLDLNQK